MGFQISPGVAVKEKDATTIIPQVSTTEGGIAAHLTWGPVEKRILVSSEDVLFDQFRGPNANTYPDFFTCANFLAYGNQLHVVRVVRQANTAVMSTDTVMARNAITNAANNKNTFVKNSDHYEASYSSGITSVGAWIAKYPGDIGNTLRVSVCPTANAWSSTLTGTLTFTNNSLTVTGTSTLFSTQVTIGDILICGPDRLELKVNSITNATSLILQSKYVANTAAGQTSVNRRWEWYNSFESAPGSSDSALAQAGSGDEMHIVVGDEDGRFSGAANTALELYSKVSKASDAKKSDGTNNYYKDVINSTSRYMWWAAHLTGVSNAGKKVATVSFGAGTQSKPINASFVLGRDGNVPRDADYINCYNLFRATEEVDVSFILAGETNQTRAIHIINNIAEYRKDCIVVMSPRRSDVVNNNSYIGKERDDSITFRNLLPSSSYAVLDSGYKYQYDKYNDVYRFVPLNGDVAGLIVRTDETNDPWWSPAGYNRGNVKNVIKLAYNPGHADRDQLFKNGLNPIVTFVGQGTLLFGDKTLLAKPSAFDQIGVRRLFIVLEKAIATAAKFSLFEFNDEFTRAQFRNIVTPFLRDVQGRRGIHDFRVVCDETNNTGEVIDRNEFIGDIYIKPARAIRYISLNFIAVRTNVEFSEIVGKI